MLVSTARYSLFYIAISLREIRADMSPHALKTASFSTHSAIASIMMTRPVWLIASTKHAYLMKHIAPEKFLPYTAGSLGKKEHEYQLPGTST